MSEARAWTERSIKRNAYLRGRIGWQGLRADEFGEEGPYLVTGTDFQRGKIDWSRCYHVSEARYREAVPIQLREDDLLVTKDGTIGKIAHVANCPPQAVLNSGVFLLRCSDGSFQHRFLYYLLTSHHFEQFLRKNLAGSTINHLYQYVFEKFAFLAPDNDQQLAICKILDFVDTQIEATESMLGKLERMRAGLMQDLFTRGVDEDGALRPPREEAPKRYHRTELGWLPNEWSVKTVGQLSKVKGGKRLPAGSDFAVGETQFPYLRVVDFVDSSVDRTNLKYVTPEIRSLIARYTISSLDLYISIAGTIGLVGSIPKELNNAQLTENAAKLSDIQLKTVRLSFLKRVMSSNQVQRQIWKEIGTGGGVPKLALFRIERLFIPMPPVKEQRRIAIRIAQCERLVRNERMLAIQLGALKSGLMQDLLSGRASVETLPEREIA